MINFILGAIVGTYFSRWLRPIFEKAFTFCKTKFEEYRSTETKSD